MARASASTRRVRDGISPPLLRRAHLVPPAALSPRSASFWFSRGWLHTAGTVLNFTPGVITNGRRLTHDCGTSRGIGYFLELLLCVAPFGKQPLHVTLTGITNDNRDPSVDIIRTVTLPLLKRFGVEEGIELKVTKRGAPPLGGGEVVVQCPIVRKVSPLRLLDASKVKRVRGLVYSTRVAPTLASRLVWENENVWLWL